MTENGAAAPVAEPVPVVRKRNHWLVWFTLFLLFVGAIWLCLWFFYLRYYESTDDAYANGNLVNVNPAVSGSVIAFYADDTDLVQQGQLLAQLDPTEYRIKYEKELALLASTVQQVCQLYANVEAKRAAVESKRAALQRQAYDFDNRSKLLHTKAISNEDFVHSQNSLTVAKSELKQAEAELQSAIDVVGSTPLENHPRIAAQQGQVRSAYYNLQHCTILAPTTGYVAQRAVNVGQWVEPTTDLMAIIPTNYMWVDANFKETQLTYMRLGQPATVWFDLYGSSVKYAGKVLGIAMGSGSVFSLIPPQNATGNWIKIVQRLPVRISLEAEQVQRYPPRLGISAQVSVDITEQQLPLLAMAPTEGAIATTTVFELPLEELEQQMQNIIRENCSQRPQKGHEQ